MTGSGTVRIASPTAFIASFCVACAETRRYVRTRPEVAMGLAMAGGCALYTEHHVSNSTPARFVLEQSESHRFTDLVACLDEERSQIVVYGKVAHSHERCLLEGHVDLAVVDSDGAILVQQSLPIVNRGGRRGW